MSRVLVGEKAKLVSADGSIQEVTVEHIFQRRGHDFASVRFADSHLEMVEAKNLNPEPPHPFTETQAANRALDELAHVWDQVHESQRQASEAKNRALIAPKTTGTEPGEVLGMLLVIAVVFSVVICAIWVISPSTVGCFLADNFDYVTASCALGHLQKPTCSTEQDILAVDEVKDISYTDEKGNRVQMRSVVYEFRKRPLNGPVSADILRDTQTLYKTAQGKWKASCEQ